MLYIKTYFHFWFGSSIIGVSGAGYWLRRMMHGARASLVLDRMPCMIDTILRWFIPIWHEEQIKQIKQNQMPHRDICWCVAIFVLLHFVVHTFRVHMIKQKRATATNSALITRWHQILVFILYMIYDIGIYDDCFHFFVFFLLFCFFFCPLALFLSSSLPSPPPLPSLLSGYKIICFRKTNEPLIKSKS